MAVCGRCWLCSSKFDCGRGFQCEGCARTQHVPGPAYVITFRIDPAGGEVSNQPRMICRNCISLVESGAVANLIDALRNAIHGG